MMQGGDSPTPLVPTATDASGPAVLATPGNSGTGQTLSGYLESSNIDPVKELVTLIKTQRSFELNSQSIQTAEQALQTLRDYGVDLAPRRVAGPLAVLARLAPTVTIRALGVFQVSREGTPIPTAAWQSRKARELLKILVARRRPTPRDALMGLLWPEVDPVKSANRLSVLLSLLRDVLAPGHAEQTGPGPLVTDGVAVWLDPTQVSIDVEEFLTLANDALAADSAGEGLNTTQRLAAAAAAFTGNFLEDDPYQDWAADLAEEVRATHLAVLRALSGRLRRAGDTDRAVRYTLRLLGVDRYDEAAHLALVAILLEAGRLGEARRRYALYARQIAELGVTPQPFPGEAHGPVRQR